MRIRIVAICLMLLVPAAAFGDDKVALAREIMELSKMNQMMEQVKLQVQQMQVQLMAQLDIPEDKKEKSLGFQKKINNRIFEIMSFENMEAEYIALFTDIYTLEELKGISDFYKSPVGRSMIEKQPLVMMKALEITQNRMRLLIPELQKMTEEFERELKTE